MEGASHKWKRQPGKRPDQIIQAALKVFGNKGFQSATMDEIAEEAGITKGTIYLYFPSKEELFVSMLRAQFQQALDLLPKIAFDPAEDPETATKRVGKEFLDVLMTPEVTNAIPLVIAEFNHLPALKDMYHAQLLPQANLQLAGLLSLGMELGLLRKLEPVIAARCLFGMFFIFVMTQEVFRAKEITQMSTDDIVDTIVSIYFHGIVEKGSSQ